MASGSFSPFSSSDYLKKLRKRDPSLSEGFQRGGGQFVPPLGFPGPLSELNSPCGVHPEANCDDGVEAIEINIPGNPAPTLILNC